MAGLGRIYCFHSSPPQVTSLDGFVAFLLYFWVPGGGLTKVTHSAPNAKGKKCVFGCLELELGSGFGVKRMGIFWGNALRWRDLGAARNNVWVILTNHVFCVQPKSYRSIQNVIDVPNKPTADSFRKKTRKMGQYIGADFEPSSFKKSNFLININ